MRRDRINLLRQLTIAGHQAQARGEAIHAAHVAWSEHSPAPTTPAGAARGNGKVKEVDRSARQTANEKCLLQRPLAPCVQNCRHMLSCTHTGVRLGAQHRSNSVTKPSSSSLSRRVSSKMRFIVRRSVTSMPGSQVFRAYVFTVGA